MKSDIFKRLKAKVEHDTPVMSPITMSDDNFNNLCTKIGVTPSRALTSIGTLGGG